MQNVLLNFLLLLGLAFQGYAQPNDNPYRTRFQPGGYHWTDSLSWTYITIAGSVQGLFQPTSIADSFNINMAVFDQKMDEISGSGGGVFFFSAGRYFFENDILLKSNVIIRGVASNIPNARAAGFEPETKFSFPQYFTGNARSSAFKKITADTNGITNAWRFSRTEKGSSDLKLNSLKTGFVPGDRLDYQMQNNQSFTSEAKF